MLNTCLSKNCQFSPIGNHGYCAAHYQSHIDDFNKKTAASPITSGAILGADLTRTPSHCAILGCRQFHSPDSMFCAKHRPHPELEAQDREDKAKLKPVEPVKKEPVHLDAVVEANRTLLLYRSQVGLNKYGTGLAQAKYSRRELLQHALEEALDLANYLQAQIMALDAGTE